MLTLKRVVVVVGCSVAVVAASALPALANGYGSVSCNQDPSPDCHLGAGINPSGSQGGIGGGGHRPGPDRGGSGRSGAAGKGKGDATVGGGGDVARCSYVRSDYQPPAEAVTVAYAHPLRTGPVVMQPEALILTAVRTVDDAGSAAVPNPGGSWYVWKCITAGTKDALYHPPLWIANGQPLPGAAPAQAPSPAALALMARNELHLPTPTIAANPPGEQLVSLPTWLWLAGGWAPLSATASVPGVSVTAVATPTSVRWSMGDGSTVTCTGAGTPYHVGRDPNASSPDCGHVYRRSSAGQVGQAFSVTATVHWMVSWAGAGQRGTFPDMTTTGNAAFRVAESQALNSGADR
jgi:hypothetical protein